MTVKVFSIYSLIPVATSKLISKNNQGDRKSFWNFVSLVYVAYIKVAFKKSYNDRKGFLSFNFLLPVVTFKIFPKKNYKNCNSYKNFTFLIPVARYKNIRCTKKWSFPLRIWSHLLKKYLMENFIFCAVYFWQVRSHSQPHPTNCLN